MPCLKTWIIGLVDDHSRFVIGLRIATDQQSGPILAWLRDCVELCGRPLDLMSDNGSPFVVWMPGVLTSFGKTLRELEVRHIRTQIDQRSTVVMESRMRGNAHVRFGGRSGETG